MPQHTLLPSGPVTLSDYRQHLDSSEAKSMRHYSGHFLQRHRPTLRRYHRKWTHDPFHHWSRQWEYPYAAAQARRFLQDTGRTAARLLDAGAGITFFPYLLRDSLPGLEVECCDRDPQLERIYPAIEGDGTPIAFRLCDLARTGYEDRRFDLISCISVLEHTRDYPQIVAEFHRLLRPGGRLILSFDLSLDGLSEITSDEADPLLDCLGRSFRCLDPTALERTRAVVRGCLDGLVTTRRIASRDRALLPWRQAELAGAWFALKRGRWPRLAILDLSFACHTFEKLPA